MQRVVGLHGFIVVMRFSQFLQLISSLSKSGWNTINDGVESSKSR